MHTIAINLKKNPERGIIDLNVSAKAFSGLDFLLGNASSYIQPIIPYNNYFNIFDFVY